MAFENAGENAAAPANEESAPSGPDALVEQRGHTLIVTLNRPQARNALSTEMMEIMVQAWDRVDNDPAIRCCILTGAGGYFCAGMDLKAATKKPPGESFKDGSYDPSRIDALLKGRRLKKPLIAAVEGPAIAGGTEILQGTDIRVACESAKFGISEAKWSLYPMGGSAVRLVRQIPYTVACDLLLTGRHITAAEAKDMGLIGHVVPDGQALSKALESDASQVGRLFKTVAARLEPFVKSQTGGSGAIIDARVTSGDAQSKDIDAQIARANARIDSQQKAYSARFAGMEKALGSYQSQGAWLGSMIQHLA